MKFMRHLHLCICALILAFSVPAFGQYSKSNSTVLMTIVGEKQGIIRGEVQQKGWEGRHKLLAYSHEIVAPYDPATGMPTGKRQHQPFRIVKLLNQGSPLLTTALTSNENITSVTVEVWSVNISTGFDEKVLVYTLTNARIASIRPWMPNHADTTALTYPPAEEIAFTYQKIDITFPANDATSSDGWNGAQP